MHIANCLINLNETSVHSRIALQKDRCFWSLGRSYWTLLHCFWVRRITTIAANTGIATYGTLHQVYWVHLRCLTLILNNCFAQNFLLTYLGSNLLIKKCWLRLYSTRMKWYAFFFSFFLIFRKIWINFVHYANYKLCSFIVWKLYSFASLCKLIYSLELRVSLSWDNTLFSMLNFASPIWFFLLVSFMINYFPIILNVHLVYLLGCNDWWWRQWCPCTKESKYWNCNGFGNSCCQGI